MSPMDLSVVAVTFGLIFVAELPDKTMIAAIVLSSRHRPLPVWIGAAAGHGRQRRPWPSAAGRLLELLPHRWVEGVVAALFAGRGALPVLVKADGRDQRANEAAAVPSDRRVALAAFARHRRGRARRPHPDPHRQPGGPLSQPAVGLRRVGRRPRGRHGGSA